ncbi:MAG: rhodanese-like domain-containing protein [Gammaproteobacteria bacterium]|nr:rhodanese-like domain-containing protein [Gammaproteobacteria bacterium]MDH5693958.1 rhodanese-like domain-containing protein [Gammaproteobacteria bacterium]
MFTKRAVTILLASLIISTPSFAGKKIVPEFVEGTTKVEAEQLIELAMSKPNLVIVDSRKKSDFKKGFIEGAVSLPDTDTNEASLNKHLGAKNTPVVFYCNGIRCGRSMKAAKVAISQGYKSVYWFRGGVEEWESKGLPLVKP